ncbi:MAG: polysaccharide biosynthesis transport protein [Gammaproteobacteria bacterium]|jgi:exopolysaccharide transport family protein|nr:polysaccharide biosynthesis transport protein [Gammaproteobacteria bacterium]
MDDISPHMRRIRPLPAAPLQAPLHDNQLSTADLRSIIGILLRNLKFILAIPVIAVAIAYGILHFVQPQYKSTTEILAVDTKRTNDPASDKRLSVFDVDQSAVASEIAVIMSQSVATRVVKQLNLDTDPEFLHSLFEAFIDNAGLAGIFKTSPTARHSLEGESPELERATYELRERHLKVERQGLSYVLAITATSTDALKAQRIATAIAQAYVDAQREVQIEGRQRALKLLDQRLVELRDRVLEAESSIEKLKAASGLIDTGNGTNTGTQAIGESNSQLSAAQADVAEKKARYEQALSIVEKNGDIQSVPEVMSSPVIVQLRVQRSEASRHEADLRSRFGARFPEVISAQSQVGEVNAAIAAEVRRIIQNMKNSYAVAVQRELAIKASFEQKTEQRGDSTAVVKLAELKRTADADRKIYEEFLVRVNGLQQISTLDQPGIRIITAASIPNAPSFPRKTLVYLLVVMLAIAFAVALAFVLEYLNPGFKTPTQVESVLKVSVLGMVPRLGKVSTGPRARNKPPKAAWTRWSLSRLNETIRKIPANIAQRLPWNEAPGRKRAMRIASLRHLITSPSSNTSEAIRTIRSALAFGFEGDVPRVFLVTSSMPSEGKSTFSILFSVSAAISRNRTLLIDCDLRRGSSSKTVELGKRRGLADYLRGRVELSDVIYHKKDLNLFVLPCGTAVKNPADLLASPQMGELIVHLRQQFDYIVLDTPPILPVVDAAVLARCVDKILFVIQWQKTPRRCVMEAIKGLSTEARSIASVILNNVDRKRLQSYGYGYGFGYNYGSYYRSLGKYYERT